ncbi:methyltransferase domain-containing protein [Sinorhizobium fredii]
MPAALDPFRITDKLDENTLDVMIGRLEVRGHHPYFAKPLSDYLDRMEIDRRSAVLDLGCGTGIAARAIAARPGFEGTVLGIDRSDYLVHAARRFADSEKLSGRVRFECGDSHALGLGAASFDAVIAHTLFSHLDDPAKVPAEMRRVLRPDGVAAIFDGDFASLTFELADAERSRRMDDAIIASLVTNPRILRQMPRLLKDAGFAVDAVMPAIVTEVGTAEYWKSAVESFAKLAPKAGILSEAETTAWVGEVLDASAQGVFFGSSVYYAYVAHAV